MMVEGLADFRAWFAGFEENYTIIGGTACDVLMSEAGLDFRSTKDVDMVIMAESISPAFGRRFWDYVLLSGYRHLGKRGDGVQFYRFSNPSEPGCPAMIELFSRLPADLPFSADSNLTPIPMDGEVSSLSAILLDESYYGFLLNGRAVVEGLTVLDAAHLIPFKAKAWLDLTERRARGEQVDSRDIRKHRNDVFRLSMLLSPDMRIDLPDSIFRDLGLFFERVSVEGLDLKQLGIQRVPLPTIIARLNDIYGL